MLVPIYNMKDKLVGYTYANIEFKPNKIYALKKYNGVDWIQIGYTKFGDDPPKFLDGSKIVIFGGYIPPII